MKTLTALSCFFLLLFSDTRHVPGVRSRVENYRGKPTIFIDNQPVAPIFYALTDVPGGRRSWDEVPQHNIRRFCEDGIRLFQVDIFLEQIWLSEAIFDLTYAQKQVAGVLEVCPEARVFFRFHVNPPRWWQAKKPSENVVYDTAGYSPDVADGLSRLVEADPRNPLRTSLASEKWRSEIGEKVARFCREFARTKEGRAVAGLQVACGVYGEWHQWGFLSWEADFGEPMRRRFADFLIKKYTTEGALRAAWNDISASFSTVSVPDSRERAHCSGGNFRDPRRDQRVIDYYQCQHETVADDILFFCQKIKENWPRPVITGAFYGYFFSCFNRQAAGGHLALQRVLRSPWIDYLAGPQAYLPEAEKPGEPYRSRSLTLSMRLNGKLWLDEMDQQPRRTFAYIEGIRDNREKYAAAVRENVAQLRRNLAFSHSKGAGLWLYDFGPAGMDLNAQAERSPQWGSQGYWDHPAYHEAVRDFKKMADRTLHEPYRSEADVLLVYDTEVNFHTKSVVPDPDSVGLQAIDFQSLAAFYAGVVFDAVHLDDLEKVDFSQYRTVVFANTFLLDAVEKKLIREKIARDGRHLVWIYAPGFSDGKTLDARFVSEVSGFKMKKIELKKTSVVEVDAAVGAVGVKEKLWGATDPIFAVDDPGAQVFGRFREGGVGALAVKDFGSYSSWFSSVPLLNFNTLRFIFKKSGAHVYGPERDIFYGGAGVLSWHTNQKGLRSATLRSGKIFQKNVEHPPATFWIDMATGEEIE